MFNYSDAFKKLSLLEQETFPVTTQGISDLKNFLDKDAEEPEVVQVIDPEATSPKEIKDSYLGKIILECPVCSSLLYKDGEEVNIDEESEEKLVNTSEECPYCFTTQGYKIIGKVTPFEGEEEVEVEVIPSAEEESPVEEEVLASEVEDVVEDKEENDEDLAPIDFDSTALDKQMSFTDDEKKKKDEDSDELFESLISEEDVADAAEDNSAEDIWNKITSKWPELMGESLQEGVTSADVDLDDKSLNVSVDGGSLSSASLAMDDGKQVNLKVVQKNADEGAEMVAPLDDADKSELAPAPEVQENELPAEMPDELELPEDNAAFEEPDNFEDFEITGDEKEKDKEAGDLFEESLDDSLMQDEDVEEFETEGFDKEFNNYLHDNFDNVDHYESSEIRECGEGLMLEGIITFNNGNKKKTSFKIMPESITTDKHATFICENLQMKNKIQISGKIENGRFM